MREKREFDTEEYAIHPIVYDQESDPSAGRVRVEVAGQSHIGLVREINEDHFLIARLTRTMSTLACNLPTTEVPHLAEVEGYILAVADGLGGHAAGERASRMVIRNGLNLILAATNWALKINATEAGRLVQRMREYFVEIDHSMMYALEADPSLEGMATTLTVAYTVGPQAFLVHVGDSRVYRYHDGALEQMTRDHTVAQKLADTGVIRADEVRSHAKRHVLTNVIAGRPGEVRPDVATFPLSIGDTLLVCSDGLHDAVDDHTIGSFLRSPGSLHEISESLVSTALAQGGRDNISVALARYHPIELIRSSPSIPETVLDLKLN